MIKRIIACLTICLIITGLISPVFSDASALPQPNWSDPGISEIINISDLTGWMLNGGTFDVSTYTDAESFMNDYYAGRTSTRLVDGVDLYYNEFGIGQDLYNIGAKNFSNRLDTNRMISSSFREHSGYGRRFSEQVNDALLSTGSLYDMKIPLLNDIEFANFVGYNHDALKLYSQFFDDGEAPPSPSPDPNYAVFVNNIIGLNIGGYDFLTIPLAYSNQKWDNRSNYSYYKTSNFSNGWVIGGSSNVQFYASTPITLYLTGNDNDGWQMNCSISNTIPWSRNGTNYDRAFFEFAYINSNKLEMGLSSTWYSPSNIQSYSSGSLNTMFNWLNLHFRHCNIYVNNVLWGSIDDNPIIPKVTPEFPDAVGGEELPNTTWPISRPRAPYYTSVPGMLQAIEDAIQGDGELDIDDLKPYLTDSNGDPVPDPIFDPEPIPIPVPDPVNPDVVPGLPELPVIPLDMPGYNGVSVLAEIINFTNQSLPTSLIVTFWGIVFGIVILGLIKILHK